MQEKKIVPPEGSLVSPPSEVVQKPLSEAEAGLTSQPALPRRQAGPEQPVSQALEEEKKPFDEPSQPSPDSNQENQEKARPPAEEAPEDQPKKDPTAVNRVLRSSTIETSDLGPLVDKLIEAQGESET